MQWAIWCLLVIGGLAFPAALGAGLALNASGAFSWVLVAALAYIIYDVGNVVVLRPP